MSLEKKPFHQPAKGAGYRANVDAIHLARFACTRSPARAAFDLGAGAGLVGLTLLELGAAKHVTFVELDDEAARYCEKNLTTRDLDARASVVTGDALVVARNRRGEADLVVCNPPYVAPGAGRPPPEARRARARQGDLRHFVEAARTLLGRRGRVAFVYPARELLALASALREHGLEPKRIRMVHSKKGAPARIVLVEAQAAKPGGLVVEPPLVEIEA